MNRNERYVLAGIYCAVVMVIGGCSASRQVSTAVPRNEVEKPDEAASALRSVVGAISGNEVDDEDLVELGKQIRKDPEARQAVETLTHSMSGGAACIKYSPVTGKRYGPHMTVCPDSGVQLEYVDPRCAQLQGPQPEAAGDVSSYVIDSRQ